MRGDNGAELLEELEREPRGESTQEDPEIVPTASRTDLLFACTYPWGRRAPKTDPGPPARFGLAFHKAMELLFSEGAYDPETIASRHGIDAEELRTRVEPSYSVLRKWLTENLFDLKFIRPQTEVSVAYNPWEDTARDCLPPTEETHEYSDRRPGEIPGTADLVAAAQGDRSKILGDPSKVLVVDYKSGWDVGASWQPHTPAESGQLRSLALAFSRLWGAKELFVAFLHAPAGGAPEVLSDRLTLEDLEEHRRNLRRAMGQIGSGWMRPREWCAHCPGFSICPAQSNALVALNRPPGPLSASRVGAIHQATGLYDKLRERLRDEIRAWVKQHGPGIRPDGQIVDLVETETTNLSQASIERALGPLKGAKEIERLNKLGCIEKKKRVELRARKQ